MANFSSTSTSRRFSRPRPAIFTAFSIDECAWVEAYAVRRPSAPFSFAWNPVARSRAARSAHSDALDAVSWMTPPPAPSERNFDGQSEHSDEPVEHVGLELRARGARRPEHPLDADPGRQELPEDRRARVVRREVREEVRRLPVRDARQDQPFDVREHRVERLPRRRRIGRELRADLPRLSAREHRQGFDPLHVVRDPVHHRAAVAAELLRGHVRAGRVAHSHSIVAGGFDVTS